MNITISGRFARKWVLILSSIVGIGWLGVSQANAAKILFIVSAVDADGTANLANDEEVVARLQGKGHTVTLGDDQDAALDTLLVGQDLIVISSSVGSGNQPLNGLALDPLKTGTKLLSAIILADPPLPPGSLIRLARFARAPTP